MRGDGIPPEPDWTSLFSDELDLAFAHEQCGLIIREMQRAGTLAMANGHVIERLVRFRVVFERASREIAERGRVLKAKRTGVPQTNPYWAIMRQAAEEIRVIKVELGIPPVRRGKASRAQRSKKAARPTDAYLRQVKS